MLKIEGINKSFGEKKVLEDINLSINQGEVYGLIGANGAGKSTLFKIIIGNITNENINKKIMPFNLLTILQSLSPSVPTNIDKLLS